MPFDIVTQGLELCRHIIECVEYTAQEQQSASSHSEATYGSTIACHVFHNSNFPGQVTDIAEHAVLQVECLGEAHAE